MPSYRAISALLVVGVLICTIVTTASDQELLTKGILGWQPDGHEIMESRAWKEAKQLTNVSSKWVNNSTIIYYGFPLWHPDGRVIAEYDRYFTIEPNGRFLIHEVISIYITHKEHVENPTFVYNALVHEFLHSIYVRKIVQSSDFGRIFPDSEIWVRTIYEPNFKSLKSSK